MMKVSNVQPSAHDQYIYKSFRGLYTQDNILFSLHKELIDHTVLRVKRTFKNRMLVIGCIMSRYTARKVS